MATSTSTAIDEQAGGPWNLNLASAGYADPPPRSDVNASFTRDKYIPVQLSVDGLSILSFAVCIYQHAHVDYRALHEQGFLKIQGLIPPKDVQDMSKHMDDVLAGRDTAPGFPQIDIAMPESQRIAAFSRIHNAHRVHALHERFLLHPRILDVLEQLNGPDVLALQSMSFFKQPGQPGQG